MEKRLIQLVALLTLLLSSGTLQAKEASESRQADSLTTIWPLVDYRTNSATKTSKLSILGPILSFETTRDDNISSFRPLFHTTEDLQQTRSSSYYLFPIASAETTPDVSRIEFLQILQKNTFRKAEPDEKEDQAMLFPFYISGESKKYGAYTAVFPIYGDIYERFWRDEYHFVLFPLYGRTVNKGTTNYHYLWPFFSLTRGDNESGFGFWPLYGQASKEGVYSSSFTLWPIFTSEKRGLNTAEPSSRFTVFPLYSAYDSPSVTSRTWLWPFFGYSRDSKKEEEERNYLWPFWLTVSGKKRNVIKFLPFYSDEQAEDSTKNWYLWPLYRNDTMQSPHYRQERDKILFFLYTNRLESWAQDGKERRRTALWPVFLYNRDTDGEKSFSFPALIEPIFDRDGIEKLWAPLWRIYDQKWNDAGDSSLSLFWNLYWHESSSAYLGVELFPLFRYRSADDFTELQILKGLVSYQNDCSGNNLSIFWIPFSLGGHANSNECERN